jgi:hypothetical protein
VTRASSCARRNCSSWSRATSTNATRIPSALFPPKARGRWGFGGRQGAFGDIETKNRPNPAAESTFFKRSGTVSRFASPKIRPSRQGASSFTLTGPQTRQRI